MISRASTRKRLPSVKLADSVVSLDGLHLKPEPESSCRRSPISPRAPRTPNPLPGTGGCLSICRIPGCGAEVPEREGSRPVRVCTEHRSTLEVDVAGTMSRFCEQCSRMHPLDRFDSDKRGCRLRLERRNIRRKKQSAGQRMMKKCAATAASSGVVPPVGHKHCKYVQLIAPHLEDSSSESPSSRSSSSFICDFDFLHRDKDQSPLHVTAGTATDNDAWVASDASWAEALPDLPPCDIDSLTASNLGHDSSSTDMEPTYAFSASRLPDNDFWHSNYMEVTSQPGMLCSWGVQQQPQWQPQSHAGLMHADPMTSYSREYTIGMPTESASFQDQCAAAPQITEWPAYAGMRRHYIH